MDSTPTSAPSAPAPSRPELPPVPRPAPAPPIAIDDAMLEAWLTGRPPPPR